MHQVYQLKIQGFFYNMSIVKNYVPFYKLITNKQLDSIVVFN